MGRYIFGDSVVKDLATWYSKKPTLRIALKAINLAFLDEYNGAKLCKGIVIES